MGREVIEHVYSHAKQELGVGVCIGIRRIPIMRRSCCR